MRIIETHLTCRPGGIALSSLLLGLLWGCSLEKSPSARGPGTTDTSSVPPSSLGMLTPGVDPGAPGFPDTIEHLSVRIVTGSGKYDGTDDLMYLCLAEPDDLEGDCFALDHDDYNDNESSDVGVWHFPGVDRARADVSQISLRTEEGADQWVPICMDLRFDGEPVYCEDALDVKVGDAHGETTAWIDPEGLHSDCRSCGPGPLTHSPLLGGPEPDRFRVQVRTDATRQVILRAGTLPDLSDAVDVDYAYPGPEDDFTATLEARGASPDQTYHYGIVVDGELHAPPWTPIRTAPLPGMQGTTRLAIGSCSKNEDQPIFDSIGSSEPDLFLLVGDAHYANSGVLGTLRRYWRWSWERPERAAFLSQVPSLVIWDDHDFVDNNSYGADFIEWPEVERDNALKAFTEYTANPTYGEGLAPGVFFHYTYGDIDLFFLDGRFYRDDPDDVDDPTMLGDVQLDWLLAALSESTATFKFLISGSTWSLQTTNTSDGWAAHQKERDVLFDRIASDDIPGVVLVSGDVHRSEIRLLEREGSYTLPEITSSNLAYSGLGSCRSASDLITCVDEVHSFVVVDTDTTLPDPMLTATILGEDGSTRAIWATTASALR